MPSTPRTRGARLGWNHDKGAQVPFEEGFVTSFDGTRLYYACEGPKDAPPLVFCYGLVCSSLHWTYQIDLLRERYRCIWWDYRAHHRSDVPSELRSLTIANFARDLGVVLDHLGIQRADLLAHSMGVSAVLEFAHQFPDRVRSLVLTSGTASRPLENLLGTNALQSAFSLMGRINAKRPKLIRTLWYLQRRNPLLRTLIGIGGFNLHLTPKQDVDQYIDDVIKLGPEIFLCLIDDYAAFDATAWLHTLRCPTLVIAGEKDGVIPHAQQELLHQLIPGSEMWTVPRGSHCPQMDFPEAVTARIEKFVSSR